MRKTKKYLEVISNYGILHLIPLEDGLIRVQFQKGIRAEFEPKGIKVFPMSAVTGQGVKELLYEVNDMLANIGEETTSLLRRSTSRESMTGSVEDAYT